MNDKDSASRPALPTKVGARRQLGHFQLPERTIEHDFVIQERYQAFSAELLRLALVGLGAIGLVAMKLLFPDVDAPGTGLSHPRLAVYSMLMAAVGFGVSAAAALVHRYASVDSVSWHIQSLRRDCRNEGNDADRAAMERARRHALFSRSKVALGVSASALGLSAGALALAMVLALA